MRFTVIFTIYKFTYCTGTIILFDFFFFKPLIQCCRAGAFFIGSCSGYFFTGIELLMLIISVLIVLFQFLVILSLFFYCRFIVDLGLQQLRIVMFSRLVSALIQPEIRGQFLYMPSIQQQQDNMNSVLLKYKLPNVIGGVDSCHSPLLEKPRNIPEGRNLKAFVNRNGCHL